MNSLKTNNLRRVLGGAAASVLLASGLAASGQPFMSPVGDWDFTESGVRQGVAQITFNADNTMTMRQIIVTKAKKGPTQEVEASRGGVASRGGTIPDPDALPVHTNLYGGISTPRTDINFTNADGGAIWAHLGEPAARWGFDISGKLIGFFSEISAPALITTNLIPIGTNEIVGVSTNIVYLTNVDYLRLTNAISFSGKVSYNLNDLLKSKITLLCSTPDGKVTFSGLPTMQLPDISTGGTWYGFKKQNGLSYTEFFDFSNPNSNFTLFDVDGEGPDYIYSGAAIVTRQKKIGIVASIVRPHAPPDLPNSIVPVIRAFVGSVNLTKPKFDGKGLEGSDNLPDAITYKGVLTPVFAAP